jgi:hypothetical protein
MDREGLLGVDATDPRLSRRPAELIRHHDQIAGIGQLGRGVPKRAVDPVFGRRDE